MPFNQLSELRPGTNIRWAVRVFVSRLWHHRGGTDNGPIKHTDMVLLDAEGNNMYAEVPEKNVDDFMDMIKEGHVYDLGKFFVFPKKYVFRPVEGKAMIKFTKFTTIVEREGLDSLFPFCTYELTPFTRLPKPSDMPQRFTDVLGVLSGLSQAVQYHNASRAEPSTKRIIHIKDLAGNQLTIYLWGQTATDFDGEGVMALSETEPIIIIFVGTLIKTYDGVRALSGSAACRWYINEVFPEIDNFRKGLRGQLPVIEHIDLPGQTDAEINAQVNLQTLTVGELLAADIFDQRDVRFFCDATLIGLRNDQRWWFPSCTICHKTAMLDGSAYKCSNPDCLGTDAVPRYKLCFMAADDGDQAEFVFFDRAARDLIGVPLISLLRHGHAPGATLIQIVRNARDDESVPKEIALVSSRRFRFVVSISNKVYGKENGDVSFQVHRIDPPLDEHPHAYRALGSVSGSGASGSSTAITRSPNIRAYETLSPEERPAIPLHGTPPSVSKAALNAGSASVVKKSVRRNLFPAKSAVTGSGKDKGATAADSDGNEDPSAAETVGDEGQSTAGSVVQEGPTVATEDLPVIDAEVDAGKDAESADPSLAKMAGLSKDKRKTGRSLTETPGGAALPTSKKGKK